MPCERKVYKIDSWDDGFVLRICMNTVKKNFVLDWVKLNLELWKMVFKINLTAITNRFPDKIPTNPRFHIQCPLIDQSISSQNPTLILLFAVFLNTWLTHSFFCFLKLHTIFIYSRWTCWFKICWQSIHWQLPTKLGSYFYIDWSLSHIMHELFFWERNNVVLIREKVLQNKLF